MAYKLVTSAKVHSDVENGIKWYKEIQLELARRFLEEVRKTEKYVHKNPKYFQIRYNNIRIAFLDDFPYGIHYSFEKETVTLLAVFHFKESPDHWIK